MKCDICGEPQADFSIIDFEEKKRKGKKWVHLSCEYAMRIKRGYEKNEQNTME